MTSKFPVGTKLIAIDSTCLLALGTECIVVKCPYELFGDDVYVSFMDAEGNFVKGRDYNDDFFRLAPVELVEEEPISIREWKEFVVSAWEANGVSYCITNIGRTLKLTSSDNVFTWTQITGTL